MMDPHVLTMALVSEPLFSGLRRLVLPFLHHGGGNMAWIIWPATTGIRADAPLKREADRIAADPCAGPI